MAKTGRAQSNLGLSLLQSDKIYDPQSIARRVVNMMRLPDGTLETYNGQADYDPKASNAPEGPVMGLGHLETYDGANQVTIARGKDKLKRHEGWNRTWTDLSDVTYDPLQPFPDVCLPVSGCIVWSNGIDRPLAIDCAKEFGRLVVPLGFSNAPAAPTALSPAPGAGNGDNGGAATAYGAGVGTQPPNMNGYSVPGNIGTVNAYNGEDGAILSGSWLYCVQWEDCLGNLSPLSPPSNAATIANQSTGYVSTAQLFDNTALSGYTRKNTLDLLLRAFCVRGVDEGESHVKAIRIYRTTDTLHSEGKYHLLARIEGRQKFIYPDRISDSIIVNKPEPVRPVVVPSFRVACEYQGRLVIGNFNEDPGMIRWSQPGFIGTFEEDAWAVPDSGGAQITGLCPYDGSVFILTETSVFRLDITPDGPQLSPVSQTLGCVAPQSVRVLPDGRLAFLGRTSVFATDGRSQPVDIGQEIQNQLAALNSTAMGRVAGAVDPQTGLYLLALPVAGAENTVVLGFDYRVQGWRQFSYDGDPVYTLHAAAGRAGHLLMGMSAVGSRKSVRVWNLANTTAPSHSSVYESVELRMDPQGLTRFRVFGVLLGFVESDYIGASSPAASGTLRVWRTSRLTGAIPGGGEGGSYWDADVELVGEDYVNEWGLGDIVLASSSAYFRTPEVTWRKVPVDVNMVTGFRFQLTVPANHRVRLHGIAILWEPLGIEASRVPGPMRSQE